jgi:N-carbamoylputrescine amidase
MKVALIQHACSANLKTTRQHTEQSILTAAQQGAELVLLQELHGSLYFCQTEDVNQFDLAKPIPSEETDWLSGLAKQLKIVIVSSLFEKRAAGLYHNTAVVFEKDGTIAGKYRKMHIPDDPNFYEKFYFTIGDLGFQPIQTSVGKLGVLVCWDQWYPEAARLMALAGAEILLYPTAIGWNPDDDQAEKDRQKEAWITIQRSHAIANGIPVLSCNRCGLETDPSGHTSGIQFWGNSFVVGAQGEFLAQASIENPEILIAEIDKKRSEDVRRIWPFLRDRRIDYYQDLTKRYLD